MAELLIYPSGIKGQYNRSIEHKTQKISNASNACSGNTNLASWGEYKPSKCHEGDTYYCNTLTTESGTFKHPDRIQTTGWNISSNIPNDAIVDSIKVEYAYALAQYTSAHGGVGCGRGHISEKPTIALRNSNGKEIASTTGHLPGDVINMKTGSLKSYSVKLDGLPNTIKDLKDTYLTFKAGPNIADEFCRLLLQYIRIKITYHDANPKYKITSTLPSKERINTAYNYTCKITNSNSNKKNTTLYIQVPKDTTLSGNSIKLDSKKTSYDLYKRTISASNDIGKNLIFTAQSSTAGSKSFYAYLNNYGTNTPTSKIDIYKPTATAKLQLQTAPQDDETFTIADSNPYICYENKDKCQYIITLSRSHISKTGQETIKIKSNLFPNVNQWTTSANVDKRQVSSGEIEFYTTGTKTFPQGSITIKSESINLDTAQTYTTSITHIDKEIGANETYSNTIRVKSQPLKKEYFKLRLEDGSDVQYNSLIFARGDDLVTPLTYDTEDITELGPDDFYIKGETKRIPLDEAEYIKFDIGLTMDIDNEYKIENVLAYIDVVNQDGEDCSDIVVGVNNEGQLFDMNDKKYCVIKQLSNKETTTLKIAVQSDTEQNCTIRIRPYNYTNDAKWIPGKAIFKDLPNIKLYIDAEENKNDLQSGEQITVNYYIENKSDVDGEKLKFQILEPSSFKVIDYLYDDSEMSFNDTTRIISFNNLPAHSKQYILSITYQATKKGVYDFILQTVDNPNTTQDDQNKNIYKYNVMVDILSDVRIKTLVSNSQPSVGDIIDFTIRVRNLLKPQNQFKFNIKDIGDYNPTHSQLDYEIVYVNCENGTFTKDKEDNNNLGMWEIDNIPANSEYELILSLKPTKAGLHTIETNFVNIMYANTTEGIQNFTDRVKVLEGKKKIEFDVHHAVIDTDKEECPSIDDLIEICDTDYINLGDDIYYIFEVTNNSNQDLVQNINVYGRLPPSFLENEITCYSGYKPVINQSNGLLSFSINKIPKCETIKWFIKITPTEEGIFTENFMLSTKTAKVLNKQLHLTVDSEFNQREVEHEISIYNFEKTNKYYRYEIDNNGEIFKFYNKGDRPIRPIETESYDVNLVEKYKGNNLKRIAEDIKENSKYVDPIFLRIGNNKLADKGYELYPDGFIRRFGLLKSEVFHYSNQLPQITNLGEKAFKWNIDEWDNKVWAGDLYNNGIFDLTIDYGKIPSNFDILDVDNPINKLQNIVNKTKPYGTKGICYYSSTSKLKFKMDIENLSKTIAYNTDLAIKISDIYIITLFNRHDASLSYFYDAFRLNCTTSCDLSAYFTFNSKEKDYLYPDDDICSTSINTDINQICVYDDRIDKTYIEDCMDIVRNLYNINNNTKSMDISIPYTPLPQVEEPTYLRPDYQFINCINNCENNQFIGYKINYKGNKIEIGYTKQDIENFEGFVLKVNNKEINKRSNNAIAETFSVGVQTVRGDDTVVLHFWGSINKENYYHIGFVEFVDKKVSDINTSDLNLQSRKALDIVNENTQDTEEMAFQTAYCSFINTNEDNDCQVYHSWQQGTKIPVTFSITNQTKEKAFDFVEVKEADSKKWLNLNNIKKHNKYALFDFESNIDKECDYKQVKVPRLAFKYNTGLSRTDEVVDIDFTIKAQSNKDNFADDININVLKDGDYHYPIEQTGKIYYPQAITNTTKDLLSTYVITQPNITICTECYSTHLGFYDRCPKCNSQEVSHHKKTEPVTICNNCGWVASGTNKYCKHCLSIDVDNVDVDYNKTYCNDCHAISDGYYNYCPKCFKNNTIYLDNKQEVYQLFSNRQNIKPIPIKTDMDNINIFNITIPFNQNSEILNELDSLVLNIHYTNNNNREYYYCEDCGTGGLGNFDKCPKCNSINIVNKQVNYNNFQTYINTDGKYSLIDLTYQGEKNNKIASGSSVKSIDLMELSKTMLVDEYTIQFYIVNASIDENVKEIMKSPIDDKYLEIILNKLNTFDFIIDNITVDYVFKDNNNWLNLEALEGDDHTGIKYEVQSYEGSTEPIILSNFNMGYNNDRAKMYLAGICKSATPYNINITFTDNNYDIHFATINNISETFFNYEIDLIEAVGKDLRNLQAEIVFQKVDSIDEIIITNCDVLVQKDDTTIRNVPMVDSQISYENENNKYLFKSDNLWGLKETQPYYLSGRQLETNLLCYLDFGKIASSEYIRLYDIDMTIYYKTKTGKISTENLNILKNINLEQSISGQINKENGEIWGSIKESDKALNNLESEKLNIDEEGNLINSLPLYNKISQSFIYPDASINKIDLDYFGKKGYPSDIINIYLFDDYNNNPNNIIAQNRIAMPDTKGVINIDFDVDNLNANSKYWIVIEDNNADSNNYHRFCYNNKQIGTLILDNISKTTQSLSMDIYGSITKQSYYNLPVEWTVEMPLDDDVESAQDTEYGEIASEEKDNSLHDIQYKMTNTFYRYNVNELNNTYLSNLIIRNGHLIELDDSPIEESIENEAEEDESQSEYEGNP